MRVAQLLLLWRLLLLRAWHAWLWLRAPLARWLAPLRALWPSLLAPLHIQVLAVLVQQGAAWAPHPHATRALQRVWADVAARRGAAQLELFADLPFVTPSLVLWRSYGQRFAVYYPERCPERCAEPLLFPPTLARPRAGSLLGGPRGDHYRGAAWETPSWLRENPPALGNTE